jgi:TRAP-type C4-dicarboxylate transport system substrate-binding protein
MPEMTRDGSLIQACAVPSFFLPMVPGYKIFEIPYLFRDKAHAARYPTSELAKILSAQIEDRYQVKVLGHFLVAYNVGITSTDKPIIDVMDFSGRYVNDGFESFEPMWVNIKPARRYDISFTEAVAGALHKEEALDTSIGMLQNSYTQKQYTKFNNLTIAPSFYTFFYTFMINQDVWNELSESQQNGILRAADAMQVAAIDNESATAIYHAALNNALGVTVHHQSEEERQAWASEFSGKVRDGILEQSEIADQLRNYLRMIEEI